MDVDIIANHYYSKDSGILLYSNVSIFEENRGDTSQWINHSFIRILDEYPSVSQENRTIWDVIAEYLADNALPMILILGIIGTTIIAILRIRHRNMMIIFEEYKKEKQRKEETTGGKKTKPQKNKNNKKQKR